MPNYTISYTQSAYWTMEVSARNEDEAIEKAKEIYKDDTDLMKWGGVTEAFYQNEGKI
jgi:hypothetical protein